MSLACMLRPCSPKKASFCKNLLLCHFPAFFSIVFKEQPILFVRKWAQCYLQPVFFTMLTKSEAFIIVHTPSIRSSFAQELCWKARLTRTSGMALHFEIFVISCIDAAWHATPWWVATTKISKCNSMPLVRVSLAFQHSSWMNASLCVYIVKRQAAKLTEPISLQMNCSL